MDVAITPVAISRDSSLAHLPSDSSYRTMNASCTLILSARLSLPSAKTGNARCAERSEVSQTNWMEQKSHYVCTHLAQGVNFIPQQYSQPRSQFGNVFYGDISGFDRRRPHCPPIPVVYCFNVVFYNFECFFTLNVSENGSLCFEHEVSVLALAWEKCLRRARSSAKRLQGRQVLGRFITIIVIIVKVPVPTQTLQRLFLQPSVRR